MDQPLTKIIDEALAQLPEILDLDAPRAEAWASDLISLTAEVTGSGSAAVDELVSRLGDAGEGFGAVAAKAVLVLASEPAGGLPGAGRPEGAPDWFDALGTSRCNGAWVFSNKRGESAVFGFVDSLEVGHVLAVDLVPGSHETVGEVIVGPPEMIGLADDPDSDVHSVEADPPGLASRVATAVEATREPSDSLVMNGHLLVARIAGLAGVRFDAPMAVKADSVPEPLVSDPDDDAWAIDILVRALDLSDTDQAARPPESLIEAIASAAQALRSAAQVDAPMAQWLAASRGPVDLDEPDHVVVIAALAAAVRPHNMVPLDSDAREAVVDLEWADWLGVVIGLLRDGPGASTLPGHLVDLVNRCPEVTSSIPKSDRPRVEWALAVCTESWDAVGVIHEDQLTELGTWVLPMAILEAWKPEA